MIEELINEGQYSAALRELNDLSDEKIKRRAAAYLQRHGFGYDVIKLYLT